MAVSEERLERDANVQPTPQDKGLIYTIQIKAYDNGHVEVDGTLMDRRDDGWLGAGVVVVQKVEHLRRLMRKRAQERQ